MDGSGTDRGLGAGDEVEALIARGEELAREGDFAGAATCFRTAAERAPTNARARNGLGVCLHALEDASGAVDQFVEAVRLDPENPEALANLSDLTWQSGLVHRVAPLARRILALEAEDGVSRARLAALGIVPSDLPSAVVAGVTEEQGGLLTDACAHLANASILARVAWPDILALLHDAPAAALERYLDVAPGRMLMVAAGAPEAEAYRALGVRRGLPVVLVGSAANPAAGEYVLPEKAEAAVALLGSLRDAGLPEVAAVEEPEILATVVVPRPEPEARLIDRLDRIAMQDVDPALYEVLLLDAAEEPGIEEALGEADLAFDPRVLCLDVERDRDAQLTLAARGRFVLEIDHNDLEDRQALRCRIEEAGRSATTSFGRENVVPRSTARAVALVRGWDQTDLTRRCLASIRRDCPADVLRVIYVDNGSDMDAYLELVREFPDVEHVRHPENMGSCRGINSGFALASLEPHEFVLLLDNDTEIPEGDRLWLERWMGCFDDPTIGAAGAVTDNVAGKQSVEQVPETYVRAWESEGRGGKKGLPRVGQLVSFAMMLRRAALDDVGWLADERFEPGNSEDTDLVLRMRDRGWHAVVAQSVWIHHHGSQTFRKFDLTPLLEANHRRLMAKYGRARLRRLGADDYDD